MERAAVDDDVWESLSTPPETAPLAVVDAAPPTAIVATPKAQTVDERIDALVNGVFEENLSIVADVARFRDIDPGATEPPAEWVAELGKEGAWKRFRVARSAWLGLKDAPAALSIAKSIASSLALARAKKGSGQDRSLKIEFAVFPAPQYARLEVTEDE
jgi:hypothetical protein